MFLIDYYVILGVKQLYSIFALIFTLSNMSAQEENLALELDAAWKKLKENISACDFDSFKSVYHQDAIMVNGISKKTYPIKQAFEGWEQGFDDTKSGIIRANLDVQFSHRLYDKSSAHEIGIFHNSTVNKYEKRNDSYIHFESLWVKKDNKWLIMMEYQISRSNKEEWDELR